MSKRIKKIFCFGGGTAMPKAVLAGLKECPYEISTTASMLESGGSSGQLRVDFKTLSWGDLRRHLLALSEAPEWKKKIFHFRVGREVFDGGHVGHPFGNIFLAGLELTVKNLKEAIKIAHEFLEVKGRVFPLTVEFAHIYATLETGEVIFGEDEIDVPRRHNPNLKIKEIHLAKKIKAYPPTLNAIKKADLIVIGPGDLYSSLIPCFLPEGVKKIMQKSKVKKVLIVNPMTKLGETNNFSILDFVNEVEKYLGCNLDYVIYNNKIPPKARIKKYKKDHRELLDVVKINKDLNKKKFIGKNLLVKSGPIEYDPKKVVRTILNLCKR
jgi:uncharacterized cofD-like protein